MRIPLVLLLVLLLFGSTNSAVMRPNPIESRNILPEESSPLEKLRDPEGRYLGFYEDGDRNPDKFHFYNSIWEADEQRDIVIRRNNRHAGEDLTHEQVVLLTNQHNEGYSVLLMLYILGLYCTWVPYAISVVYKFIKRRRSLRRAALQRAAQARATPPPPVQPPPPPTPPHVPSILHTRPDPAAAASNAVDPDLKRTSRVQFNLSKKGFFKFGAKAKGIQQTVMNLIFGYNNRVGPSGEQLNDDEDSLSEDDTKQGNGKSTEFRVQVEKPSGTGWAESENEGDVDTGESSDEDEGSMWNAWKKLRQRSNKVNVKDQTEDYFKYYTDTLW